MIEVNARFPAWVAVTALAGANLPDLLLRLVRNEPVPEVPSPRIGTPFMRVSRTTISKIEVLGSLQSRARLVHERNRGR
jgi:carbamoyl-phosphate synthase large subunit